MPTFSCVSWEPCRLAKARWQEAALCHSRGVDGTGQRSQAESSWKAAGLDAERNQTVSRERRPVVPVCSLRLRTKGLPLPVRPAVHTPPRGSLVLPWLCRQQSSQNTPPFLPPLLPCSDMTWGCLPTAQLLRFLLFLLTPLNCLSPRQHKPWLREVGGLA